MCGKQDIFTEVFQLFSPDKAAQDSLSAGFRKLGIFYTKEEKKTQGKLDLDKGRATVSKQLIITSYAPQDMLDAIFTTSNLIIADTTKMNTQ